MSGVHRERFSSSTTQTLWASLLCSLHCSPGDLWGMNAKKSLSLEVLYRSILCECVCACVCTDYTIFVQRLIKEWRLVSYCTCLKCSFILTCQLHSLCIVLSYSRHVHDLIVAFVCWSMCLICCFMFTYGNSWSSQNESWLFELVKRLSFSHISTCSTLWSLTLCIKNMKDCE